MESWSEAQPHPRFTYDSCFFPMGRRFIVDSRWLMRARFLPSTLNPQLSSPFSLLGNRGKAFARTATKRPEARPTGNRPECEGDSVDIDNLRVVARGDSQTSLCSL